MRSRTLIFLITSLFSCLVFFTSCVSQDNEQGGGGPPDGNHGPDMQGQSMQRPNAGNEDFKPQTSKKMMSMPFGGVGTLEVIDGDNLTLEGPQGNFSVFISERTQIQGMTKAIVQDLAVGKWLKIQGLSENGIIRAKAIEIRDKAPEIPNKPSRSNDQGMPFSMGMNGGMSGGARGAGSGPQGGPPPEGGADQNEPEAPESQGTQGILKNIDGTTLTVEVLKGIGANKMVNIVLLPDTRLKKQALIDKSELVIGSMVMIMGTKNNNSIEAKILVVMNEQNGGPGPGQEEKNRSSSLQVKGAYTLDKGTVLQEGKTYLSNQQDTSGILVTGTGQFQMSKGFVKTSGETSSNESSSFIGLNAGILVNENAQADIQHSQIITTGTGSNGVFAYGKKAFIKVEKTSIDCTAGWSHAVMASGGGSLIVDQVTMITRGKNSGAIATDRGSGTITVTGGSVLTTGIDSPGIYSTGIITVKNAKIKVTGAEAAVIEGANSIDLTDTSLSSIKDNSWGVMVYQSFSGDAEGSEGRFAMTGGELNYLGKNGPLFYVTNTTGIITLKNVQIEVPSGVLLNAGEQSRWGNQGSNGGHVVFNADNQLLKGSFKVDSGSSLNLILSHTSLLTGAVDLEGHKKASVILDSTSQWIVTADSYVKSFTDPQGIKDSKVNNLKGDASVFYDKNDLENQALHGKTYSFASGKGVLAPF